MLILGITCHGTHDTSACLVQDGEVLFVAEEERFSRVKHDNSLPTSAICAALAHVGASRDEIDHVVFSWQTSVIPFQFGAFLLRYFPRSLLALGKGGDFKRLRRVRRLLRSEAGVTSPYHDLSHHLGHAASTFYPSPFDEALVVTLDGLGDFDTGAVFVGRDTSLTKVERISFPHSLGLAYSSVTEFLGFESYSEEGKVMGLASYGEPSYSETFERAIKFRPNGRFEIDVSYFNFPYGLTPRYGKRLVRELGPPRVPESELTKRHMDVAASLQCRIEDVVLHILRYHQRMTGQRNLCLAGGLFLNSQINARIAEEGLFDNIFVQPAAGDPGIAIGSALQTHYRLTGDTRRWRMEHAYLGPEYDETACERALKASGLDYERPEEIAEAAAAVLAAGKTVGWFQGRMEIGPRALGNRSILADPCQPWMKDHLNARVKHREGFRPYAPSVPVELAADYFDIDGPLPYMLFVCRVQPERRAVIPAVTHVDGTARLQTVDRGTNPLFHALHEAFNKLTGVPVLLNTSFNVRGQPIVCTPEDAIQTFLNTELDALAAGPFLVKRTSRTPCGSNPSPSSTTARTPRPPTSRNTSTKRSLRSDHLGAP